MRPELAVPNGIGTLNEKPLHAALKRWCAGPGDTMEVPVDGFTVDLVRGDLLIEVQTRNLSGIRRKLSRLLEGHPVRLVYPVARERWIVRQTRDGTRVLGRRKSPRRGTAYSLFEELVGVAGLLAHPGFSFQLVLIREEEIRRPAPGRAWRRKGWTTCERRLLDVVEQRLFEQPRDMLAFVPDSLSGPFTTGDLARATGRPVWLAQKMAYCLRTMGAIEAVGKRGRSNLYTRPAD